MSEFEKKKKIASFILCLITFMQLFINNVAPHTIYSKFILILFIFYSFLFLIINRKCSINYYIILYLLFFSYILFANQFDLYLNYKLVQSKLSTIFLNILFLFFLYNDLKIENNLNKYKNIYILANALSLIVIMFLCRNSLFTTRLAHAWGQNATSYYFFGQPVAMSSNLIGFYCDVSILLCIYSYKMNRNNYYLFLIALFVLGLSLTGSRKAFLLFGIFIVFSILYFSNNKINIIKIFESIIIVLFIYFLIIKVPFLYNMVGKRFNSLINYYNSSAIEENSIAMRNNLKNYAIKMIYLKPYYGYGLGYFESIYYNVVENNYLELLVSSGIIGTILYYLYLIPTIFYYFYYRKRSLIIKILGVIVLSILITEIGSSIYYERSYIMFIPILIYALMRERKNELHEF